MQTPFSEQKISMPPARGNRTHRDILSPRGPENDISVFNSPSKEILRSPESGDTKHRARSSIKLQALWILVVLSVLSPTFLFALDNTVVADVQPSIINTFGGIDKLPWISVAFAMGAISFNLVW